ncbi:MAG: hypothetical protein KDD01_22390 [Phaeodactylibacter sp.]|nr:hypothetical protein [Phaeodactylibacter sp.]
MTTTSKMAFILFILTTALAAAAQKNEADYVELIRQQMGGQKEVAVNSGYVDLVTGRYAIEVEFANKWKQSIGQALWYGLQTDRTPGVVLIKRGENDHKYVIQFGSALQYAGLEEAFYGIFNDLFKYDFRKE